MTVADFLDPGRWLSAAGGPLYVQLRRRIEGGIAGGALPPDSALPPEREIAALTGLSRVTVRKAIAELAAKGAVVQRKGSGSRIAPRPGRVEQSLSRLTSFTEDMDRRGLSSDSRWLERGLFVPSPDEALAGGHDPQVAAGRALGVASCWGSDRCHVVPLVLGLHPLAASVLPP